MRTNIGKMLLFFSILFSFSFIVSTTQIQQIHASEKTKFQEMCIQWQQKYANRGQKQIPDLISAYEGYGAEFCRMPDQSFTLRKTVGDRDITLSGLRVNIFYGSKGEDLRRESYDSKIESQKYFQGIKSKSKLSELVEIPNGAIIIFKDRGIVGNGIISGIYTSRAMLFQQNSQCSVEIGTLEAWNLKDYPPSTDPIYRKDHDNQPTHIELLQSIADDILNNPVCTEKTNNIPLKNEKPTGQLNYTQALAIKPPKESDFQKVSKSDFKLVYPMSTNSATPKPATESAILTGTTFIGKVGGDGELILQLPDGKEVKLTDDKSAFEGERPYSRWRDIISGRNYVAPKKNVYIEEIDCHILLEQERRDQEIIKRTGGITYASDWGVDDTIIIKPIGDCSYINEGGPIRVLAGQGQVTLKTPGGGAVLADNADFGIGYNAKSAISIFEVYNGSITVTNKAGNAKTISATYGSEIKQIEVDKNGVMGEKIAIPLSQWQAFLASKQEKKDETKGSTLPLTGAVAIIGIGGIAFFLYRTDKLTPFYRVTSQKITEILKRFSKTKEND